MYAAQVKKEDLANSPLREITSHVRITLVTIWQSIAWRVLCRLCSS